MFVFTFIVRAIIAYVRKGPVLDEEDNVGFLKEEYPPKDSSEDIANIVKSLIIEGKSNLCSLFLSIFAIINRIIRYREGGNCVKI